jgi:hypothetical protein
MAAREAGRLPTRDEWLKSLPRPERKGFFARLFAKR